jgi:hypothetical protein
MQRRWTIKEGPEFDRSVVECDLPPEILQLHVSAFKRALEWDPFLYSRPFDVKPASRRVMQTNSYVGDGFVLTAYVVLYENFTVEIKWIEASPLPKEDTEIDAQGEEGEAPAPVQ